MKSEPDLHIIEADRRGETTRFCVGCVDQAETIKRKLVANSFTIRKEEYGPPPERTETEKNRATRILGELFGH